MEEVWVKYLFIFVTSACHWAKKPLSPAKRCRRVFYEDVAVDGALIFIIFCGCLKNVLAVCVANWPRAMYELAVYEAYVTLAAYTSVQVTLTS